MNVISLDQQVAIIGALTEGCSIRAVERLTGVHRDTIMRLGARVGLGAIKFHDRTVHSLQVSRIELDEAWSFVGKKQRTWMPADGPAKGDQYIYLALASTAKAILSFRVGKRDFENTRLFAEDLRERIINAPEISTDGWPSYGPAIRDAFGSHCSHGVVVKTFREDAVGMDAARRYSPGDVVKVEYKVAVGHPSYISTSYVERQNLTLRMQQRRCTRLTNGFSKKLDNHVAAIGLYVAHYNFCRVHESLGRRETPAMALGLTDHAWTIGELLTACLENAPRGPRKVHGPRRQFRVIEGGLKG
jgi:IS1 family transposase